MKRDEWLAGLLTETADFVEELVEDRFDRRPNIQGYSLDSQTAWDFNVTMPGVWITDVPSGTIYFPPEFPQEGPLRIIQSFDTYNLALETGQRFFIQKSEARRRSF